MEFARSACSAATSGDITKLRRCIERKESAIYHDGAEGRTGYTPLHYAARNGHVECVSFLLGEGAPVLARTAGGATPLMRAAFGGHAAVCGLLLRAGSEADAADADGETPLHKAASQQRLDCVTLLLRACPEAAHVVNRRKLRPQELFRDADAWPS